MVSNIKIELKTPDFIKCGMNGCRISKFRITHKYEVKTNALTQSTGNHPYSHQSKMILAVTDLVNQDIYVIHW
jgi:hypothetical protein